MTDDERIRARMHCACRRCAPDLYPVASLGPLRGEGHVTLRFGRLVGHLYTDVLLDGVQADLCVEAYAADVAGEGWIITGHYERPQRLCMHICEATGYPEPCETVHYGRVTIQRDLHAID